MLERIGKFAIIRKLGQGGMGEVFLGEDAAIGRRVAIKTISSDRNPTPAARERFLREAKAAGSLSHPNLITVHEFGEDQGLLYMVMEYLPGNDFSTFLANRSLSSQESLEIMAQVCDGLAYAHAKGVIHRDIKPSNVRVWRDEGRLVVKVMDFGVARLPDSDFTVTGALMGTYKYMAPEYLQTKKADPRCDLYAVGVMLHEALIGGHPEPGPTVPAPGGGAEAENPFAAVPPPEVNPSFLGLAAKAIAIDPAQRFQTASEFSGVLRAAQDPRWPGLPGPMQATGPLRPEAQRSTLYPSIVTPNPSGQKPTVFNLPPLPVEEPEPWWKRHWGWGVVALAVIGIAKWGLGPTPTQRPSPAATPPVSAPEGGGPRPAAAESQSERRMEEPNRPPEASSNTAETPLDQAGRRLQERPQDALDAAQAALRDQPRHARAHALVVASYYRLGRYDDLLAALKTAHAQGLDANALGRVPCIREMLREEATAHRIPGSIHEAMNAYLPPPPEGRGGPPGRRR